MPNIRNNCYELYSEYLIGNYITQTNRIVNTVQINSSITLVYH